MYCVFYCFDNIWLGLFGYDFGYFLYVCFKSICISIYVLCDGVL